MILQFLSSLFMGIIGGCISIKLISGSLIEFSPLKIDLNKLKNKNNKINKQLKSAEENTVKLLRDIERLETMVRVNEVKIEDINYKINKIK